MVQASSAGSQEATEAGLSRESLALPERDDDQPYARIAERDRRETVGTLADREETDTLVGRIPGYDRRGRGRSIAELEAELRADPNADPAAISWLDHMDRVRAERRAE